MKNKKVVLKVLIEKEQKKFIEKKAKLFSVSEAEVVRGILEVAIIENK